MGASTAEADRCGPLTWRAPRRCSPEIFLWTVPGIVVWLPWARPTWRRLTSPHRYCGAQTHAPPCTAHCGAPGGESASLYARQPANCTHETDDTGETVEGECLTVTAPPISAFRRVGLFRRCRRGPSGKGEQPQRNAAYAIERAASLVSAYGPPSALPRAALRAPRVPRTCGRAEGGWKPCISPAKYTQGGLQGHALRGESALPGNLRIMPTRRTNDEHSTGTSERGTGAECAFGTPWLHRPVRRHSRGSRERRV